MSVLTDDDLVLISGYLTNHATGDESYFWAFTAINELVFQDPERLWLLTREMIQRTTDEEALAYIAAGPLEDILAYHGNEFIERVETQARRDPNFRKALCGVWGNSRFPHIYGRVHAACNKSPLT